MREAGGGRGLTNWRRVQDGRAGGGVEAEGVGGGVAVSVGGIGPYSGRGRGCSNGKEG